MANRKATKQAKDNEFKAKGAAANKASAVKAKAVEAVKAASSQPILHVVEKIEHVAAQSQSVDGSRYKTTGAEFGFTIADGFEKSKPEAAKYRVDPQHTAYASTFANGDETAITNALRGLSETTANLQGMIACACAGLAMRLQKEGKAAIPLLNAFIEALEPLGKGLGFGRINAIRIWFTEMACVDYEKSAVKGEGKIFTLNDKTRQKEAAKFGKNPDKWLATRIEKPFWLVKPEQELRDFSFMEELKKLLERAEKAEKKPENFKTVDLIGYKEMLAAKATVRRPPTTETEPAEAEESDAA